MVCRDLSSRIEPVGAFQVYSGRFGSWKEVFATEFNKVYPFSFRTPRPILPTSMPWATFTFSSPNISPLYTAYTGFHLEFENGQNGDFRWNNTIKIIHDHNSSFDKYIERPKTTLRQNIENAMSSRYLISENDV